MWYRADQQSKVSSGTWPTQSDSTCRLMQEPSTSTAMPGSVASKHEISSSQCPERLTPYVREAIIPTGRQSASCGSTRPIRLSKRIVAMRSRTRRGRRRRRILMGHNTIFERFRFEPQKSKKSVSGAGHNSRLLYTIQ
jgi:hypothetical protein